MAAMARLDYVVPQPRAVWASGVSLRSGELKFSEFFLPAFSKFPCYSKVERATVRACALSSDSNNSQIGITLNAPKLTGGVKFSTVEEAVEDMRNGKILIVVDDAERENEGDLIFAASLATAKTLATVISLTSGLICCSGKPEWLQRIGAPLLLPPTQNSDALRTAFTLPLDYVGPPPSSCPKSPYAFQSAESRARTLRALGDPKSKASHFHRPGHIFPLQAKPGGVLERAGHTEAAVDFAELAGLPPAGGLCEVVLPDGKMARLEQLAELAKELNICLVSIEQLVRYRLERELVVEPVQQTEESLVTIGDCNKVFRSRQFRSILEGKAVHVSLSLGELPRGATVPVYVHRECIHGHIFGSKNCSCRKKLDQSLDLISKEGLGVLLLLRQRNTEAAPCCHDKDVTELFLEGGNSTLEAKSTAIIGQILFHLEIDQFRLTGDCPASDKVKSYLEHFLPNSESAKLLEV